MILTRRFRISNGVLGESIAMRRADFIDTNEYPEQDLTDLMNLAVALKVSARADHYPQLLRGRMLGVIDDGMNPFLRYALITGIYQFGGACQMVQAPLDSKHVRQTAEALGNYFDCLAVSIPRHETLLALAKYAGIPVINAGSSFCTPVQELSDLITMYEHLPKEKRLEECKLVFEGPASATAASSLFIASKIGMKFVQIAPGPEQIKPQAVKIAERNIKKSGGAFLLTEDAAEGYREADFVRTDAPEWTPQATPGEKPPFLLPVNENLHSAARAALALLLYRDPMARDQLLIEKVRRTLAIKLHDVFGFGEA